MLSRLQPRRREAFYLCTRRRHDINCLRKNERHVLTFNGRAMADPRYEFDLGRHREVLRMLRVFEQVKVIEGKACLPGCPFWPSMQTISTLVGNTLPPEQWLRLVRKLLQGDSMLEVKKSILKLARPHLPFLPPLLVRLEEELLYSKETKRAAKEKKRLVFGQPRQVEVTFLDCARQPHGEQAAGLWRWQALMEGKCVAALSQGGKAGVTFWQSTASPLLSEHQGKRLLRLCSSRMRGKKKPQGESGAVLKGRLSSWLKVCLSDHNMLLTHDIREYRVDTLHTTVILAAGAPRHWECQHVRLTHKGEEFVTIRLYDSANKLRAFKFILKADRPTLAVHPCVRRLLAGQLCSLRMATRRVKEVNKLVVDLG